MLPTIDDIIQGAVFQGDLILGRLLREADQLKDVVLYTTWIMDRRIEYISPSCLALIGYPPEDFISGGADFLFGIIHEDAIPGIINRQVECIKSIKDFSYDPYTDVLEEFMAPFKTRSGNIQPLLCQITMLLYTENADVEYSIGLMSKNNENSISECKALLQAIKRRYNEIYTPPPFIHQPNALKLIFVTSQRFDKKITSREAEVLTHLAKGFSSEEVSLNLGISSHTVETHRKNLLLKFDAKNSAELIKKASKVFWLE